MTKKSLRAIDLYGGIGGWALGFKIAGIDIVASYEWWDKANATHNMNLGCKTFEQDIRKLELKDLPKNIQFVLGSPPCTQFSFSNRGGKGDLADGLKDIQKFLEVVEHPIGPQSVGGFHGGPPSLTHPFATAVTKAALASSGCAYVLSN